MKLTNIIFPSPPSMTTRSDIHNTSTLSTYDIEIDNHIITAITPHSHSPNQPSSSSTYPPSQTTTCPPPSLLLPTLCHPHIHLDKPHLLTSNHNHPHAYPACCPAPPLTVSSQFPLSHSTDKLPSYTPLTPRTASFPEALFLTSQAKSLYTKADLYLRGAQLLASSYTQGVTSARCFVEVDHVTQHQAVEVGIALKEAFSGKADGGGGPGGMRIQLCAFAQDPLFSGPHAAENRRIKEEALEKYATPSSVITTTDKDNSNSNDKTSATPPIEVLGTTPYVETTREASLQNIFWAISTALKYGLHLDFHLDYNLDPRVTWEPERCMVWDVLRVLGEEGWPILSSNTREGIRGYRGVSTLRKNGRENDAENARRGVDAGRDGGRGGDGIKTVVLGHCTALSLLSHTSLLALAGKIHESRLPVYFVGLPSSDVYMMGRTPLPPISSPSSASSPSLSSSSSSPTNASPPSRIAEVQPLSRTLGSLNILRLLSHYGLKGCIGVNNVGNAFTPFGSGDPLEIASWSVGMYHGGGEGDAEKLFGMVSCGARRAVGLETEVGELQDEVEVGGRVEVGTIVQQSREEEEMEKGKEGETAAQEEQPQQKENPKFKDRSAFDLNEGDDISTFGLLLIHNDNFILGTADLGVQIPARRRTSVRDVVWDVPEVRLREVVG